MTIILSTNSYTVWICILLSCHNLELHKKKEAKVTCWCHQIFCNFLDCLFMWEAPVILGNTVPVQVVLGSMWVQADKTMWDKSCKQDFSVASDSIPVFGLMLEFLWHLLMMEYNIRIHIKSFFHPSSCFWLQCLSQLKQNYDNLIC